MVPVLPSRPLGLATAHTGLTVAAAGDYVSRLGNGHPETEFGWLCLALAGRTVELPAGFLSSFEHRQNLPTRMLYQRFDHVAEEATLLLPQDHRREPPPFGVAAALKGALLLDEWRRLVPLAELEARYQVHLGQIQSLASTAAHLLRSVAALVRAIDYQSPRAEMLTDLAGSVRLGLPSEMLPLAERYGCVLSRYDYLRLREADLDCCEALQEVAAERLEEVLGNHEKALKINEIDNLLEREHEMQTATVIHTKVGALVAPQSIEIDGSYEGDRFLVRINGFPVRLTGKSFKYLTKLAWSRLNTKAGWVFKEDIEIGFNQARYLYRMKGEIKAGFASNWPIIENNRLGYYRLCIQPDRIRVNTDRLREHPDYEIRSLVVEPEHSVAVN